MSTLKSIFSKIGRLLLIVLFVVVAFSYSMFQGGFVSWFILFLLLPFALYSLMLFFLPLSKMTVEREIHSFKIQKGGKLKVTVRLKRSSRFPLFYTVVRDITSSKVLMEQAKTEMTSLFLFGFRKTVEWTYEVDRMPRGEHKFEGVEVSVSDVFHWVKKSTIIEKEQTVIVYPNITEMIYMPIETRYDQGAAASPYSIIKDTTMATGIREYQPGDRVTWIHWKSFARTQTLKTKEFEDRQSQELFIVLDRTSSPLFEDMVEFTASILHAIVRHQATVSFLSIGATRTYFPVILGEEQLQSAMHHLAKVEADAKGSVTKVYGKDKTLTNATTVLLITSKLTAEWIEVISKSSNQNRSCICFVVVNQREKLSADQLTLQKLARSRGMNVQMIAREKFANAFTEVMKS